MKTTIIFLFILSLTSCATLGANNVPPGTIGYPIGQILGAELPRKGRIDSQKWSDYGFAWLGGILADSAEAHLYPNTDSRYSVIRQNVRPTP